MKLADVLPANAAGRAIANPDGRDVAAEMMARETAQEYCLFPMAITAPVE